MSGESNRDEDLELGDDFILEDGVLPSADMARLFDDNAEATGAGAAGPTDGEDALLFEDHTDGLKTSETFSGREQFAENSRKRWGGHPLSADEIGIPTDQNAEAEASAPAFGIHDETDGADEFSVESEQELELVQDDRQLLGQGAKSDAEGTSEAATGYAGSTAAHGLGGESGVADEEHFAGADEAAAQSEETQSEETQSEETQSEEPATSGAEESWSALPGAELDGPESLAEETAPAAEDQVASTDAGEAPWNSTEYGQGADGEFDQEPVADAHLVGAPSRRRNWASWAYPLSAAAMLLMTVGVVVVRPEWFGLDLRPAGVERVQIGRPDLAVKVTQPPMPRATSSSQQATVPTPETGEQPTTPTDPTQPGSQPGDGKTPPVDSANGTPTTTPTDPGVPVVGVGDPPVPTPAEPGPTERRRPLQAGEGLVLLDFVSAGAPTLPPDLGGVTVGSRTLAQLHNGNFFVGRVKSVAPESCTMRVGEGEVTLMLADVQRFSPLASEDYETLLQGTAGFLRLNNSNRLVGAVLREVADDYIVLQMRSGRITLPRAAVGQIVSNIESGEARVAAENDETWLRKMAERALQQRMTGSQKKATTPAPAPAPVPKASAPKAAPKAAPAKKLAGPAKN